MVFGSPFTDEYPKRVWDSLRSSRKGQDRLAPLYKVINATRIYDHVLKYSKGYWLFSVAGGCVCSYWLSHFVDHLWKLENKGRLYNDLPYKYPEEDDD